MNEGYFSTLNYHPEIIRMSYTTNFIGRLDKVFRKTFKTRNSMPNALSALTLLSKVAINKEEGVMKCPIYKFKLDKRLNELM
jgi:transposase-like protein